MYCLTCVYISSIGLLARSGATYLRTFLPPTNDVPGYAKLRILDSFTLTDGKDACNFTRMSDGRHFFPLDFIKLRAIAEGVIDTIGTYAEPPPSPSKHSQFIVSEERSKYLSDNHLIGNDFYELLKSAFSDRHVAFAGDSTTDCVRNNLVAYLLAVNSDKPQDTTVRKQLLEERSVKSEDIFELLKNDCPGGKIPTHSPYFGGRCSYVGDITKCFLVGECSLSVLTFGFNFYNFVLLNRKRLFPHCACGWHVGLCQQ